MTPEYDRLAIDGAQPEASVLLDPDATPDDRVSAALGIIGLASRRLREAIDAGGTATGGMHELFAMIANAVGRAQVTAREPK